MSEFDGYYQWLGIPPKQQPPNHYRLLGLQNFENDVGVIDAAADRQSTHVRKYQTGPHAALSQSLLNEIATARVCLLRPSSKEEYDRKLRSRSQQPLTSRPPQMKPASSKPSGRKILPAVPMSAPASQSETPQLPDQRHSSSPPTSSQRPPLSSPPKPQEKPHRPSPALLWIGAGAAGVLLMGLLLGIVGLRLLYLSVLERTIDNQATLNSDERDLTRDNNQATLNPDERDLTRDNNPASFNPNDCKETIRWLNTIGEPLKQARKSQNDLQITSALEKVNSQVSHLAGKKVRWKHLVTGVTTFSSGKTEVDILSGYNSDEDDDVLIMLMRENSSGEFESSELIVGDTISKKLASTLSPYDSVLTISAEIKSCTWKSRYPYYCRLELINPIVLSDESRK